MPGFGYDPELPDGFQDADFEMRDLEAKAARADAMMRAGKCAHGWLKHLTCNHCGYTFESLDAWYEQQASI